MSNFLILHLFRTQLNIVTIRSESSRRFEYAQGVVYSETNTLKERVGHVLARSLLARENLLIGTGLL